MLTLFEQIGNDQKITSALAPIEVRSAIRRRQYAGDIFNPDAESAISSLHEESKCLTRHSLTETALSYALGLVDRHNLRALDSVQLSTALLVQGALHKSDSLRFIASDHRLLRAAVAEGLEVWDPVTASEV